MNRRMDAKVAIFIGAVIVTLTLIICGHTEKMKAFDVQIIEIESSNRSSDEVIYKLPPKEKEQPKIEYKPDAKDVLQQEIKKEFTKNKPMKW